MIVWWLFFSPCSAECTTRVCARVETAVVPQASAATTVGRILNFAKCVMLLEASLGLTTVVTYRI
jgi:hypothetical protein